jgi:8-oxo-dGTP pyrophosphatase MutT (NUDIX family)
VTAGDAAVGKMYAVDYSEDKESRLMHEVPEWFRHQSGVIPYRQTENGLEVLLITSRRQKHWVVPKGVIDPELTSAASAVQEAWEEAGILGYIHPFPVGSYSYKKWQGICAVEVFLFSVEEELSKWPESELRRRQWLPYKEAAMRLREPALHKLVNQLPILFSKSFALPA